MYSEFQLPLQFLHVVCLEPGEWKVFSCAIRNYLYSYSPFLSYAGHSDRLLGSPGGRGLDCLTSQGLSSPELLMEEWVGKGAPSHFDWRGDPVAAPQARHRDLPCRMTGVLRRRTATPR